MKRMRKGLLLLFLLLVSCTLTTTVKGYALTEDYWDWEYRATWDDDFWYEYENAAQMIEYYLEETGMSLNEEQRLYDFVGQFSEKQKKALEASIKEQEEAGGISIRVFVAKMGKQFEKFFLEELADRLCDKGYASEDLAMMLLNLDQTDRGVFIRGYGLCERQINDDRTEYILDDVIECFLDKDYDKGVELFAKEAAYYAKSDNFSEYYKDNSFWGKMSRIPWAFLVIISGVISATGIGIMKKNMGGKQAAGGKTYMQGENSGLVANRDDFLRTSVSKTYSPRSSGSGGGGRSSGGGGRSRGGRSHSGGSRRF